MLCVTHDQVVAFLGNSLQGEERQAIERHLDACAECLELITLVGTTSLARGSAQRDAVSVDTVNASTDGTEDLRDLVTVDPQHYIFGHEIARGGIGRIIAARDRRHGRHVAIKELLVESPTLRARFEREARITAKLQHPAIVNLLEAGTWPSGEPFYVMKLVMGKSLDEVIARHTTLDARLSLLPNVIATVDALAYAHAMRVIHRDLKPANVVVGEFGETVVIDWGFAKDLGDPSEPPDRVDRHRRFGVSGATLAGSIVGTPAYMPAEQARGGVVDERADVHALGAILYHLLAGAPPYTGKTPDTILDAVIAGPPQPIDTLVPGVAPDLVTIVNKAMARAAEDRYPTAKELAEDLKKFQTGQLVGAHRYSTGQLLRRWIRRHRASLAVTAVAIVVLGALGVASLQRIVREHTRAEEQRAIAEQSRNEAEDLMGFMLVDMRNKVQPLGRLDMLDDIAKKAAAYYAGRPVGASNVELEKRARARSALADVLTDQGHADAALKEYRVALTLFQTLAAIDPTNADRMQQLAVCRGKIAGVLRAQGNVSAALVEYRAAVAIGQAALSGAPNDENQRTVAICQNAIGDIMLTQGELKGALDHFRATLAIAQKLATGKPADDEGQRLLLSSHLDVAKVLVVLGDLEPALGEVQAALAIGERLAAKDSTNADVQRQLCLTHTLLGDVFSAQGDYKRDLAEYRAALVIAEELATNDSTSANRQYELSLLHHRLGVKLDARGDRVHALAEFTAALTIDKRLVATDATNTMWQVQLAMSHLQCGTQYGAQGNLTRALAEDRAGLTIVEGLVAKDPNNAEWQSLLAGAHGRLGEVLADQDDVGGAIAAYRAAVAGFKAVVAKDPSNATEQRKVAESREMLGDALAARGDRAAALAEYRAALKITDAIADNGRLDGFGQARRASSHISVGDLLVAQRDANGALGEYRTALAILDTLAANDPTNAESQVLRSLALGNIGDVLIARGDAAGALDDYREALAIAVAQSAKDPASLDRQQDVALDHGRVGDALLARGDKVGGLAQYQAGLAVARRLQASHPKRADVRKIVATLAAKASRRGRHTPPRI